MEYWEFLIQQENDRTWQSLKTPEVELPQGRYRLVARCNRPDTDIDIRIIHHSLHENPPKRRLQKRSRRTNAEGLMVIIPFTDLKPGIWEFRCLPDFLDDIMGDSWKHTLQLKILPPEDMSQAGEQGSSGAKEQRTIGDLTITHNQLQIPANRAKSAVADSSPLRLTLKQETYIARAGQSINLVGFVELPAKFNNQQDSVTPALLTGEMRIRLRDPQSGKILAERQQTLSAQEIPFSFACNIHIPSQSKSHLLLGEITIYSIPETTDDTPLVLATRPFSITADLNELLSAIADNFNETEVLEIPSDKSKSATLDLASYNQATTPQTLNYQFFQPSSGQILPPLLYQPDPTKAANKKIELPIFGKPTTPEETVKEKKVTEKSPDTNPELSATEESEIASEETSLAEETINSEIVTETEESSQTVSPTEDLEAETESSGVDTAFQSLKLEERFWSRLNAIATDEELSAELSNDPILSNKERAEAETETEAETEAETNNITHLSEIYYGPDGELTAMEVVVDDEIPEPLPVKQETTPTTTSETSATETDDEPIPTPELNVPEGELIAGQQIRIRVKVPIRQPRLGVKFWVVDLQTRSLVENPRWLSDFYLDAWGNMETTFQMTVPFGCLEIRLEAIAANIQNKRESRKAQVDRQIIPPDLPKIAPDEIDTL